MWLYLLAVERSLSFLPSREARCCSSASRRELGAWGKGAGGGLNRGVGEGKGVPRGKIRTPAKWANWDTLLSLSLTLSLPSPHCLDWCRSLTHAKQQQKKKEKSRDVILRCITYTTTALFFFFCKFAFGFIRFGWPASCTHQPWIMQASPQRDGQVRTEQSVVPAGLQSRNATNTSLNRLMSPCRGQRCTNALVHSLSLTHTRTNRTHAHTEQKKNHNPKNQELTRGFHIRL